MWEIEPKILRQHGVEKVVNPNKYIEDRNAQMNAIDAAAKKSKEDAATQDRINGLIEDMSISANGRFQHGKTEEAKKDLRKLEAYLKKPNTPLANIETQIRNERERIYDAVEKGVAYSKEWE